MGSKKSTFKGRLQLFYTTFGFGLCSLATAQRLEFFLRGVVHSLFFGFCIKRWLKEEKGCAKNTRRNTYCIEKETCLTAGTKPSRFIFLSPLLGRGLGRGFLLLHH